MMSSAKVPSSVKMKPLPKTLAKKLNDDLTVSLAMLKAGLKRKPKLPPVDYARRFANEKILQQRRYCDAFALWRACANKACRRHRRCSGDQHACLKRAIVTVPRTEQWRVRETILAATPRNIGAPEREARKLMPVDFYV
jgi:hypothetical protein